jgi:hypothetical protein
VANRLCCGAALSYGPANLPHGIAQSALAEKAFKIKLVPRGEVCKAKSNGLEEVGTQILPVAFRGVLHAAVPTTTEGYNAAFLSDFTVTVERLL